MVNIVQDMYDGATARVRTVHGTTSKFTIAVGVHQGSALSPFPFITTLDTVVKHLLEGPPFTLLYADDVALIADSRAELQLKIRKWQLALADAGLKLNTKKTSHEQYRGGLPSVRHKRNCFCESKRIPVPWKLSERRRNCGCCSSRKN
ncbi:hypothetical protein Y032_0029g1858 [Ancylostoma ceylanicum]|nr:hypothetical protein Y032_0029g1858 [Ancylostoma ceylanicum]